jgi:hypothetical protein
MRWSIGLPRRTACQLSGYSDYTGAFKRAVHTPATDPQLGRDVRDFGPLPTKANGILPLRPSSMFSAFVLSFRLRPARNQQARLGPQDRRPRTQPRGLAVMGRCIGPWPPCARPQLKS